MNLIHPTDKLTYLISKTIKLTTEIKMAIHNEKEYLSFINTLIQNSEEYEVSWLQ